MSERLLSIKAKRDADMVEHPVRAEKVDSLDFDWLIEQTEQLESELQSTLSLNKHHGKMRNEAADRIKKLESENERYREALEEIAEPRNPNLTVMDDLTDRCVNANEALRSDNQ